MKITKQVSIVINAIIGLTVGSLMGITVIFILNKDNPVSPVHTTVWIAEWSLAGIVTGIILGVFAKPTYHAIHGAILGVIIGILVSIIGIFVEVFWGMANAGTLTLISQIGYGVIIGGTIGAVVGGVSGSIGYIQRTFFELVEQSKAQNRTIFQENPVSLTPHEITATPFLTRTYHSSIGFLLPHFIPAIFFGFLVTLFISLIIMVFNPLQHGADSVLDTIVFIGFGAVAVLCSLFVLYLFFRPFLYFWGISLKISPIGIEYHKWPVYHIRCTWQDIERLGQYHPMTSRKPYDVLFLKRAEPLGRQITQATRQKLGLSTQYMIPLTGMSGWPNGKLANDLQHYIPYILSARITEDNL